MRIFMAIANCPLAQTTDGFNTVIAAYGLTPEEVERTATLSQDAINKIMAAFAFLIPTAAVTA